MIVNLPADQSEKVVDFMAAFRRLFPWAYDELAGTLFESKHGLRIEITPIVFGHTDEQQGYYHKWCREFATYCGMTHDEMHEEILCQTYGSTVVPTKFGQMRRPLKRSSKANRTEYSVLIDTLIRVAAEMGFIVPPAQRRVG